MGVDPVRYVVVPRVLGLVIVLPILTMVGMLVGLTGGMVVAELVVRMSPLAYWYRLIGRLDLFDFLRGLMKSFAFAWIIGLVGAHLGLRARPDANGVGRAATRAVVTAVFWIIVFDATFESIATLTGAW
jgi:phospholipid/cholesterol/gamma-HCH transport system permease protein